MLKVVDLLGRCNKKGIDKKGEVCRKYRNLKAVEFVDAALLIQQRCQSRCSLVGLELWSLPKLRRHARISWQWECWRSIYFDIFEVFTLIWREKEKIRKNDFKDFKCSLGILEIYGKTIRWWTISYHVMWTILCTLIIVKGVSPASYFSINWGTETGNLEWVIVPETLSLLSFLLVLPWLNPTALPR